MSNPNQRMVDALLSLLGKAEVKGDKQKAQNYKRAISSMQKYPIPLQSAQEATSLVGIGDTIAQEIHNYLNPQGIPQKKKKTPQDKKRKDKELTPDEIKIIQANAKKKKRKYSPKYRTAPWAMLVGHYRTSQGKSSLSKDELITVAQPLSEAKLKPQFVSGVHDFRCGWDSHKTLMKNFLLESEKVGRKNMYKLTEDGITLAKELSEAEDKMTFGSQALSQEIGQEDDDSEPEATVTKPSPSSQNDDSDIEIVEISDSDDSIELIEETKLNHVVTFVNSLDQDVVFRDDAQISVEDDELCYLVKIEVNPPQPTFQTKLKIQSVERVKDKLNILAWIPDSESEPTSREMTKGLKFTTKVDKPPKPPVSQTQPIPQKTPTVQLQRKPVQKEVISTLSQDATISMDAFIIPQRTAQVVEISPNEPFEIILLIDIREKVNRKERSQWWFDQLTKVGVKCDQRQNEIGDFMWIAQFKNKQEVVLDFIAERKAIDDLSSSIMSERFEEQKFRIKRSNVKHKFYIIEGDLTKQSWNTKSDGFLRHAMVSIQLDGFLLKQTKTVDATILFLTEMTKEIIKFSKESGLESVCSLKQTIADFNHFNSKSYLSSKEVFGRQLSSMFGISGAKAEAIVSMYPNPKALFEAFKEKGDSLLENIKIDGKRLGTVASKRIYNLFCLDDYNLEVEE